MNFLLKVQQKKWWEKSFFLSLLEYNDIDSQKKDDTWTRETTAAVFGRNSMKQNRSLFKFI